MDRFRSHRQFDPWVVGGVVVGVVALIVGTASAIIDDSASSNLWTILALGAVGLALSIRSSSIAATIAALLVFLEINDPAPWGTWAVAFSLLFLFALRRPRFDAVAAGLASGAAALVAGFAPWFDGGGGFFGLLAMTAAAIGMGQWVHTQRRYVVAELGRRRQTVERRREEVARHVAEERLRIARELHDSVAHHLAVVSVHTNVARANLVQSPQKVEVALDNVQKATQSVLEELAVVLGVLRASEAEMDPSPPIDGDLVDELVLSFRDIGLAVSTDGLENLLLLAPVARTAAQRLLQESLTNAHRYGAGAVTVTVDPPSQGYVTITVRNTRMSVASTPPGTGLGLVGMQERVHLLGGSFHAGPDADDFVVTAQLPATVSATTEEIVL